MILAIAASTAAVVSALPVPQLSESEFRGFPDDMENVKDNKVAIYSGYSNVSSTCTILVLNFDSCITKLCWNDFVTNRRNSYLRDSCTKNLNIHLIISVSSSIQGGPAAHGKRFEDIKI